MQIPRGYASGLEAARDKDVDVIHICTPNAYHMEVAQAALESGKHVICEKPLATSLSDARTLMNLAQAKGLVATVPFVNRFHPMVREARARVQSADTGRVFLIQGSYLQDWLLQPGDTNWRVDATAGGASRAFADIGISAPRTTYQQQAWRALTRIDASQAAAGDLVFWPGHVAIVVSPGTVVHSPNSRSVVKTAPVGSAGPRGTSPTYKRYTAGGVKQQPPKSART